MIGHPEDPLLERRRSIKPSQYQTETLWSVVNPGAYPLLCSYAFAALVTVVNTALEHFVDFLLNWRTAKVWMHFWNIREGQIGEIFHSEIWFSLHYMLYAFFLNFVSFLMPHDYSTYNQNLEQKYFHFFNNLTLPCMNTFCRGKSVGS